MPVLLDKKQHYLHLAAFGMDRYHKGLRLVNAHFNEESSSLGVMVECSKTRQMEIIHVKNCDFLTQEEILRRLDKKIFSLFGR